MSESMPQFIPDERIPQGWTYPAELMPPLPPPNGWHPDDFPVMTFDLIPYTSNPQMRPDPMMTVNEAGWLIIDAGNGRIAFSNREEWKKFVYMADCLFNAHQLEQQVNNPDEGEPDAREVDAGSPGGQAPDAGDDQPAPCDQVDPPGTSDP